ncbi:hypothetical protein [Rhizobium rhizogenes]|uniref:hypothetical protein n=1 Tax=Rhizobium rhizogenes TaxID=359 RepID=UPI0015718A97|nr:hypothetical protein [Rhizobium rhizogenes]NTI78509.1 hypothetical protein [Rhizobium rhizogenes]
MASFECQLGGAIINLGFANACFTLKNPAAYAAGKGGELAMTLAVRRMVCAPT